jgi:HK97 family phage major capsid protein
MPKSRSKEDFSKMSFNELKDARTAITPLVNGYSARVEEGQALKAEEREIFNTHVTELEFINEVINASDGGMVERAHIATMPSNVANVANVFHNLTGNVNVKPNHENDPRYGYAPDEQGGGREFLYDVANAYKNDCNPEKINPRLRSIVCNAVGDDEYARGNWGSAGVLIPDAMINRILSLTPEADFLTPRMTQIPMATPSVSIPARVDKNHATSVTGGTRVYRTSETNTATKTKDVFELIKLEATEIVGEAAATNMLMKYSPISIPALIESSMRLAAVDKRIDELINGQGNGTPLGFLNAANLALLSVDRTAGQADAVIVSGRDIVRMTQRVWGYDNAIWIANHDMYEILSLVCHESPNNAGIVKMFSPMNDGIGATLWGRPIFFTEYAPGITSGQDGNQISEWSSGMLSCVNMSQYLYGELYTEFNRSVHVRFSEREEVFQFVTSNDARPWWKTTLTPKKGVTTRSPFVTLTNTDVSG